MDDFGAESLDKIKSDLSYEKESDIEVEDNSLIETSKKNNTITAQIFVVKET